MPQKLPQAAALIPGSKDIPTEEVCSGVRALPSDKEVVEYSTSRDQSCSPKSVRLSEI
jgi:hypothetical protein